MVKTGSIRLKGGFKNFKVVYGLATFILVIFYELRIEAFKMLLEFANVEDIDASSFFRVNTKMSQTDFLAFSNFLNFGDFGENAGFLKTWDFCGIKKPVLGEFMSFVEFERQLIAIWC